MTFKPSKVTGRLIVPFGRIKASGKMYQQGQKIPAGATVEFISPETAPFLDEVNKCLDKPATVDPPEKAAKSKEAKTK